MKRVDATADPFKRRPRRVVQPWVGWFRGRGAWVKVVEAQTEKECWHLLMAHHDPRSVNSERCVLRAGESPPPIR